MWTIVNALQANKNDKDLMILQKKVRFDKFLLEKVAKYELTGKKNSYKGNNKETKRDRDIAERDKKWKADQKNR